MSLLKLSVNETNEQLQQQKFGEQQNILIENKNGQDSQYKFDALTPIKVWGYGIGHFFNDLGAASFFKQFQKFHLCLYFLILQFIISQFNSYLVYYYKTVLLVEATPWVILSGQIVDALTTPLVGYFSDKFNTKIGKRKPWYILGFSIMIICFPLMFTDVNFFYSDHQAPYWFSTTYYIFFSSVINIGFASVQVSHMSLVPSLTCSRKRRDKLNSLRNTFTFLAYFFVLLMALLLFKFMSNAVWEFQILSYIVTSIGIISSTFFLIQINEPTLTKQCQEYTDNFVKIIDAKKKDKKKKLAQVDMYNQQNQLEQQAQEEEQEINKQLLEQKKNYILVVENEQGESMININQKQVMSWRIWFYDILFYQFAFVYMGVRLYCNVYSTMVNYYLCFVLKYAKDENDLIQNTPIQLALIPLTLYISSVLTSLALSKLFQKIGKKMTYAIGGFLMVGSSIIMMFLNEQYRSLIYIVAVMSGAAQAICLNTAIVLISEVVGLRGADGAFVYGAYGFMDRIGSGIALFFLTDSSQLYDPDFIKWTITLIPGIGCILAWILIFISKIKDYSQNQKKKTNSQQKSNMSLAIGSRITGLQFLDEFAN